VVECENEQKHSAAPDAVDQKRDHKWAVEPDGSLRSAMGKQSIKLIYGKKDGVVTAEISEGITAAIQKEQTPTKFSSKEASDVNLLFYAALESIGKNSN
jgi:hypothetical protein